jgi:hypothetical protein
MSPVSIVPRELFELTRYALRSRVARPDPRPEVRQTKLYGYTVNGLERGSAELPEASCPSDA